MPCLAAWDKARIREVMTTMQYGMGFLLSSLFSATIAKLVEYSGVKKALRPPSWTAMKMLGKHGGKSLPIACRALISWSILQSFSSFLETFAATLSVLLPPPLLILRLLWSRTLEQKPMFLPICGLPNHSLSHNIWCLHYPTRLQLVLLCRQLFTVPGLLVG